MRNKKPQLDIWVRGEKDRSLLRQEKRLANGAITNVTQSSLYVYPPRRSGGRAIILCPGGGFKQINFKEEGTDFVDWFNRQGVTVAILKYQLPEENGLFFEEDLKAAMDFMRSNSKRFRFKKLGVMGCSVGGYLAATAATKFPKNERPDFQILLYPVISMEQDLAHLPSRTKMFGRQVTYSTSNQYSLEMHVDKDVPPTFIALTADDKEVTPLNSLMYYTGLLNAGVSASLHIYPDGGHGFGFSNSFEYKKLWTGELRKWLNSL